MINQIEIQSRVRYSETDGQRVMHHANYFNLFEMGRIELLRANGHAYRDIEDAGQLWVVVRIGAKYHKPAMFDDLLTLRTRVTRVTLAKVEHEYQVLRGDELLAEGNSTVACIDRNGNVQRIPDWMRGE